MVVFIALTSDEWKYSSDMILDGNYFILNESGIIAISPSSNI